MEQNTSKKICSNCGSEWDLSARYCGTCGLEIEQDKNKEFGNGLSLKFFNFLYNVLPVLNLIFLLFMSINSYSDFVNYFGSNLELYLTYFTMQYVLFNLFINYVLLGLTFYTRIKKNKVGFSKVMIYRMIFSVLGPIISLIPVYFDYGLNSMVINDTLKLLISPIVFGVFATIYLTKRFEFKWFDFSDIL